MRSKANLKKLSLIALLALVIFAPNIYADDNLTKDQAIDADLDMKIKPSVDYRASRLSAGDD